MMQQPVRQASTHQRRLLHSWTSGPAAQTPRAPGPRLQAQQPGTTARQSAEAAALLGTQSCRLGDWPPAHPPPPSLPHLAVANQGGRTPTHPPTRPPTHPPSQATLPTCVDVLGGQVAQLAAGLAVELDEHQVPDLKHVGVVCRQRVGNGWAGQAMGGQRVGRQWQGNG